MTYAERQAELVRLRAELAAATRPAERVQLLTLLLHAIGQVAILAPTPALNAAWMAQYRELQPQAAELRATLTADPPPAWLLKLDVFSDRLLGFADAIGRGVEDVVGGVGDVASSAGGLVRMLPLIAIVLLVVVAIGLFKGTLRARL